MALINEKMLAVMRDVTSLGKTERNQHQGFSFRGIDAVLNLVGPALREHGVVVVPRVQNVQVEQVEIGQKRTVMTHVITTVEFNFVAEDDSALSVITVGEAMDSGDKGVTKSQSVAFRIALLQTLALPTDEKDPDHDTYERAPAQPSESAQITQRVLEGNEAAKTASDALRQVILTWATRNRVPARKVASDFAEKFGHIIQEGTEDELNEFYAQLTLGGQPVDAAN